MMRFQAEYIFEVGAAKYDRGGKRLRNISDIDI